MNQKEVWRANYLGPWNGGILTTAGDLVIQGNAAGFFQRFSRGFRREIVVGIRAVGSDGRTDQLRDRWRAVYRGTLRLGAEPIPCLQGKDSDKSGNIRNVSRVLGYKLGSKTQLPPLPPEAMLPIDPSAGLR